MDEEVKEKTIGLPETIFVVLLVGIEEFFEFLILVITLGTGILVTQPMNVGTALAVEAYVLFRGGKGVMKLIVQPIGASINAATANLAPGKTIGLIAGIWIINNPEKMEKVMGAITKIAGQAITVAATVATGGAGGVAAKVAGGATTKIAARKFSGAAIAQTERKGVSAARQRMMNRAAAAKKEGVAEIGNAYIPTQQTREGEVEQEAA